ncbi:hypothetical protein [Nakamurella sp.]|uniref:hypothetical protein n=1 Tax=Nakamurella sp. TaxID=1869182 RepID=UPI0037847569
MSTIAINALDTVDARRVGGASCVVIRPEADAADHVVALVVHSEPSTPAAERVFEEFDLVPASAARLVGLIVDALDLVDPDMAAAARTLASAR